MAYRRTINVGASQNMGQSFGGCYTSPVTWSTVRPFATGEVRFRPTYVSLNAYWSRVQFHVWLCNQQGQIVRGPYHRTKYFNQSASWLSLGSVGAGSYRLRTSVSAWLTNGGGAQVTCTWGRWEAQLSYMYGSGPV